MVPLGAPAAPEAARLEDIMTTRFAQTTPVSAGFLAGLHQTGLKVAGYFVLLREVFAEAQAEARAAQARWHFIAE